MAPTEVAPHQKRIVADPNILVGKPTICGTRISVELVLEHLAHTPDLDDLFAAYPELTRQDVQAVLAYARAAVHHERDHQDGRPRSAPKRQTAARPADV